MKLADTITKSGMSSAMADYLKLFLPEKAEVLFLYRLDSETDKKEEVLIGYTLGHEWYDGILYLVQAAITEGGNKRATVSCEE